MRKSGSDKRAFFEPAFIVSVVIMCAAVVATNKFGVIEKDFLPLQVSLDKLDEGGLGSYKILAKPIIENEEVLESLDTKDYIQWVLEDTEASDESVRKMLLFITYYGKPDRVPHVPEECYTGGGFQQLAAPHPAIFKVKAGDFERTVEGTYLVFGSTRATLMQIEGKFPVLYFFSVNGAYAGSREEARMALNKSLFKKYAYFSKVEIVFNQGPVGPAEDEAVEATTKLLSVILPRLEKRHWPDWQKAVGKK